jgi:hypothetical protein
MAIVAHRVNSDWAMPSVPTVRTHSHCIRAYYLKMDTRHEGCWVVFQNLFAPLVKRPSDGSHLCPTWHCSRVCANAQCPRNGTPQEWDSLPWALLKAGYRQPGFSEPEWSMIVVNGAASFLRRSFLSTPNSDCSRNCVNDNAKTTSE